MNFDVAFDRLMGHEQGYVNNPKDPGGETSWGISKRSYPNLNIKKLTREDARKIYRRDFWDRIHADEMYDGVAFQALDFAVNSGIEVAVRKLQLAVGVADDGYWGPVTRKAAQAMAEHRIIMRLIAERMDFQTLLSNWSDAGKGWTHRNAQNLRYAAVDS